MCPFFLSFFLSFFLRFFTYLFILFCQCPLLIVRSLIRLFSERNKIEEAYDLVKMLKNQDDKPTAEMYNEIIKASSRVKNVCHS
jgi:hypothetical protein